MIVKLYTYFGLVGISSIALWLAALIMLGNYFRDPLRHVFYIRALALALLGWGLAQVNSNRVSAIRIDNTADEHARLKAQLEERKGEVAGIRFAEDTIKDQLDLAGVKDDDKLSVYERAAAGKLVPHYLRGGVQQRTPGSERKDMSGQPPAAPAIADQDGDVAEAGFRKLPADDVIRANRLDNFNRFAALWTIFIVLLCMVYDYLSRFNRTVGPLLPLPISGRPLDALFGKSHSVALTARSPEAVRRYLERIARKGETFLYFGPADVVGSAALARFYLPLLNVGRDLAGILWLDRIVRAAVRVACRLRLDRTLAAAGRLCARLAVWAWTRLAALAAREHASAVVLAKKAAPCARRMAASVGPWLDAARRAMRFLRGLLPDLATGVLALKPVPVLVYRSTRDMFSQRFVFESGWFYRYCFVVEDSACSPEFLDRLRAFLDVRHYPPRAVARRTFNIVWNQPDPPPAETLSELDYLARESNCKLTLFARPEVIGRVRDMVEELCPDAPKPRPPTLIGAAIRRLAPLAAKATAELSRRRAATTAGRKPRQPARRTEAAAPAAEPARPQPETTATSPSAPAPAAMETPAPPKPAEPVATPAPQPVHATAAAAIEPVQPAATPAVQPKPVQAAAAEPAAPAKTAPQFEVIDMGDLSVAPDHAPQSAIPAAPTAKAAPPTEDIPLAKPGMTVPDVVIRADTQAPSTQPAPEFTLIDFSALGPAVGAAAPAPKAKAKMPKPAPKLAGPAPQAVPSAPTGQIVKVNRKAKTFVFVCPSCKKKLEGEFELQGKVETCPGCGKELTVPILPTAEIVKVNKWSKTLVFKCPSCKKGLEGELDLQGQELDCPGCNARITVPFI